MSKPVKLTIHPHGKTASVESGEMLHNALQRMNASVRNDCGGAGVCGKCRVLLAGNQGLSPVDEEERSALGEEQIAQGYRLACRASVTADATVTVPEDAEAKTRPRGKDLHAPECTLDPTVRRIVLESNSCRTAAADPAAAKKLLQQHLPAWAEFPFDTAAQRCGELLQGISTESGATLICHEQLGVRTALPGTVTDSYGLAVDLGTTTVAAYLVDINEGTLLATGAMFNPQRKFGDDVISRISNGSEDAAVLKEMQRLVVTAVNDLARQCLKEAAIEGADIDELVLVGNTTMQTIFAGKSPECLGVAPYMPETFNPEILSAETLGLELGEMTSVYLFPVISGFLGGDSVSAALGGDLLHCSEPTLVIDIGTNGELVLGCGEKIFATSCPTGPALEGAAISCGMRAVPGAIDKVEAGSSGTGLQLHSLGTEEGVLPSGVCGSGLIDAIASLRRIGALEESGRLNVEHPRVRCDERGMGEGYVLVPAAESGTGADIILTLLDIRAFQLAKSALVVGTEKLLERYGLEKIDHTCITGAFGAHFNWHNGLDVDLLSAKVTEGEVSGGANLAGTGAMLALLCREKRREAEKLADHCTALELATDPDFNMMFVERTKFPTLEVTA